MAASYFANSKGLPLSETALSHYPVGLIMNQ